MSSYENKGKVPFKDLSEDNQTVILLALLRKEPVQVYDLDDGWQDTIGGDRAIVVARAGIYRLKPKSKAVIPWEYVKDNLRYAAMDKNGDWYLYEDEPVINRSDRWSLSKCGEECHMDGFKFDKGNMDWKDSLVCREDDEDDCEW